jgi:hypothetical protein
MKDEPSLVDMHREAFEAVDSVLAEKPMAVQQKELLELIDICQRKLEGIHNKTKRLRAV